MKRILIVFILFFSAVQLFAERVGIVDIARKVSEKSRLYVDVEDYKGTVYLQGVAEMALASEDDYFVSLATQMLDNFKDGRLKGYGSFISYSTGGSAQALMAYKGHPEYRDLVLETAGRMWKEQPRNSDGIMMPPWKEVAEKNPVFADAVLAIVPYMLYSGLASGNQEYIDYAVRVAVDVYKDLYDESTGLIHQVRACRRIPEGVLTEDCWSRGNGWLALGFAALLHDLPESHPRYAEVRSLAASYFKSVLKYQDKAGLWHQEMTYPESYVEISGSALLLYGIGAALEKEVLEKKYQKAYQKGLKGLMLYIDRDGNVGNTCSGCLAYKNGTKDDYASHPYFCNEAHAFGPVLLALSQAVRMGIREITVKGLLGSEIADVIPSCHVRMVEERKGDIAWENDKVAFRIYSHEVKNKVSSGVDFWTKSVDYPVIEGWYALNVKGLDYHTDRGEGYDFYAVGRNRGIGGTGVWVGDTLYVPEPYSDYRIIRADKDELEFEISYPPYKAAGEIIRETKRIRMILGTYFYRVSSTIVTESGRDAVLAVGLTDFGRAAVEELPQRGMLALTECISEKDGAIGSAVVASTDRLLGYVSSGKDRLMLLKVHSGEPVNYYIGAGWSQDSRFDPFKSKWPRMLNNQSYQSLNRLYGTEESTGIGCFDHFANSAAAQTPDGRLNVGAKLNGIWNIEGIVAGKSGVESICEDVFEAAGFRMGQTDMLFGNQGALGVICSEDTLPGTWKENGNSVRLSFNKIFTYGLNADIVEKENGYLLLFAPDDFIGLIQRVAAILGRQDTAGLVSDLKEDLSSGQRIGFSLVK